jgi:cyclic-di-AMP phosphodiesterase PgpH
MKKKVYSFFERIPHFTKYLLVLGVIMALAFLFPTNSKFKYRYGLNQTWLYDDLVANFDFAIKKTQSEVNEDKAAIDNEFSPYYEIDLDIVKEKKKLFAKSFDEQLKRNKNQYADVTKNSDAYLSYGNYVLERLFNKGILKQDTFLSKKNNEFVINILRGNVTEKQTLQNIMTLNKTKDWLSDSLPYSRLKEPEFLLFLLEPLLESNLAFNADKTKEFKQQEMDKISTSRGMVRSGEMIVQKGGIITQGVFQKLASYEEQYESDNLSSRKFYLIIFGYSLLIGVVLFLYMVYLEHLVPTVFIKLRWIIFLMSWILLFAFLMSGIKISGVLSPYLIPFCIAPIVIKNFHNRELALVTHIVMVLIIGLILSPGYEFIFLQIMTGLVVVFSKFETRYWGNFFKNILSITAVYALGFLGLSLIEESNISNINWSVLIWISLNGFLTLLAYPLIPLLGSFFGFTSSITLAELSDLNHPLLKELSLKAPGTLQHSLQVANLSDSAAKAIGADDLLIKVAAMYHDIGKTQRPTFFIENQSGSNPHDNLPRLESARIIIEHVTEGVKMAEKNGLPRVIIDFIASHHGTTMVEYFYRMHIRENPDGEKDKPHFQYAGSKPKTKEESILMLADSLEASSKSLKNPDNRAIDDLVERIINDKISQGQLQNSPLSFDDLEKCKLSFKQTLKNIHHVRIEYPAKLE